MGQVRRHAIRCLIAGFALSATIGAALGQVIVQDAQNKTFSIARPAQRIISIAPHVTELVYAAGAGSKLIAAVDYSDYPPEAAKLPRVGSAFGVNVEAVLKLKPDLVIAWQIEGNKAQLAQLRALGIPVLLNEPTSFESIAQSIEDIGKLTGTAAIAQAEATRMRARVAQLTRDYRGKSPLKVFYQITEKPLLTINGKHFISDAIALCGGVNVFAHSPALVPEVSAEGVLAVRPDVLIGAAEAQPGKPLDTSWIRYWKTTLPDYAPIKANRFITLEASRMHRHTPRALEETAAMCEKLDLVRRGSR
jgi:iron complex transport system substrate-binding protein